MNKFIFYFPRILSVLIVSFFAVFILEGLDPDFGWQDSAMHAVLALIASAAAVLAWKKPKIGGGVFIVFGILFSLRGVFSSEWPVAVIVGGVPLIAGILFLVGGYGSKQD